MIAPTSNFHKSPDLPQPSISMAGHVILHHQLVHLFAKLAGQGNKGHPMGLSPPAFALVIGSRLGIHTHLGQRQLKKGLPKSPAVAGSPSSIDRTLSGLPEGGGQPTIGSVSILGPEPAELPRVAQDREGQGCPHPRHGPKSLYLEISLA